MTNICVVVTNRASYARAKSILSAIRSHPELNLQLIVGAGLTLSGLNVVLADGFKPAATVHSLIEGGTLAQMPESTGLALLKLAPILESLDPDYLVTIADRYETLANAITGSYMNIPVAHVQGGERTGSIDNKVRHAITQLADIHFPATTKAGDLIQKMVGGVPDIRVTGCPSIDLAKAVRNSNPPPPNGSMSDKGSGADFHLDNDYVVVQYHPVTTEYTYVQDDIAQLIEYVKALLPSSWQVVWMWPNIDAGTNLISKALRQLRDGYKPFDRRFRFYDNFEPEEFYRLLIHSRMLIGNSSVGIRECSYLGTPVIDIGSRQTGRERASNVIHIDFGRMPDHSQEYFKRAVEVHREQRLYHTSSLYGEGDAGQKIADHLALRDTGLAQ